MFSEYFIDRPRFAGVISVIMILLGLLAIAVLPVSQYPQITPPQIVVSTTYPGASAQVWSTRWPCRLKTRLTEWKTCFTCPLLPMTTVHTV